MWIHILLICLLFVQKEEAIARKKAERQKILAEVQANKLKRKEELGDDYVSEEELVEDDDDDDDIEEDTSCKSHEPNISCIFYPYNDQTFWVAVSGYDAGYIYQISLDSSSLNYKPYISKKAVSVPTFSDKDVALCSIVLRWNLADEISHYFFL